MFKITPLLILSKYAQTCGLFDCFNQLCFSDIRRPLLKLPQKIGCSNPSVSRLNLSAGLRFINYWNREIAYGSSLVLKSKGSRPVLTILLHIDTSLPFISPSRSNDVNLPIK
ncbi:hypothetical protein P8452_53229 [Trifolium repens]|nr:hypothetical protein P8452_53229 [Trifolium repens]